MKTVPTEFVIGESLSWTIVFDSFPASSGWAVSYYFRGAGMGFNAVGTASGDAFEFAVPYSETEKASPGVYSFQAFAVKGSEKKLAHSGTVTARASLAAVEASAGFDNRSVVKKTLDAIDARISGDVSRGVMEYTIADRQLKRYSLTELRELRKEYARLYAQEQQQERTRERGSFLKIRKIKFTTPR